MSHSLASCLTVTPEEGAEGLLLTGFAIAGSAAAANAVGKLTKGGWPEAFATWDRVVAETGGATTLTLLRLNAAARTSTLAWCGDSPAVLIRDGKVAYFAQPHGYGNHVIRCLGANKGREWFTPEVVEGRLLPGDAWLVASDGLDVLLDDGAAEKTARRLLASLRRGDALGPLCERLAQAAIDAGSRDNVTVAIAVVEGS